MGIRHQFWVIAKVGRRYRALAVAHCQNATGTDATRACWRLLNIFGSSANKKLIHHDLNYASTKSDDWWEFIQNSKDFTLENRIPFPFIQTCLILGAAYDSRLHNPFPFFYPVVPYETGISPMNLLCNNQTGYTIVDITDTDQLRYCFMFPPVPPPIIPNESNEPPDEDEPLRCHAHRWYGVRPFILRILIATETQPRSSRLEDQQSLGVSWRLLYFTVLAGLIEITEPRDSSTTANKP
jgi:hypothetical protein